MKFRHLLGIAIALVLYFSYFKPKTDLNSRTILAFVGIAGSSGTNGSFLGSMLATRGGMSVSRRDAMAAVKNHLRLFGQNIIKKQLCRVGVGSFGGDAHDVHIDQNRIGGLYPLDGLPLAFSCSARSG